MKNTVSFILAAVLAFGMAGCTDKDKKNDVNTDTVASDVIVTTDVPESTPEVQDTRPVESSTDTIAPEKTELTVKTETFYDGGNTATLMYPSYGDGEHNAFDKAMRDFALTEFAKQGMMPEDNAVYEILTCDIKLETEYFVSAVVTGQLINPTAAHDLHFAYTVNADTSSGRIYLSEELVGDIELIKAGFTESKFAKSYGIDGLMDFVTADEITGSWRSDYGIFPDMYFTDDSFGIVAELPHAVGGYAGFEIPYADTGDMINPVANGLCGIIVTTD